MKKETKILLVKSAVTLVAGIAVAAVATAAIKNIVPTENLTKSNKVIFAIGTIIISSLVAEAGADHVATIFDGFFPTTTEETEQVPEVKVEETPA